MESQTRSLDNINFYCFVNKKLVNKTLNYQSLNLFIVTSRHNSVNFVSSILLISPLTHFINKMIEDYDVRLVLSYVCCGGYD
jgi:hypothetical protein